MNVLDPIAGPQKKKHKEGLTFNRKLLSPQNFYNPRLVKDSKVLNFVGGGGGGSELIADTGDKGRHKITQNQLNVLIIQLWESYHL